MLSLHSATLAMVKAPGKPRLHNGETATLRPPDYPAFLVVGKPAAKPAFAYGLPGSVAPIADFDPLNLLEGKSKEQVSSSLRLRNASPRLYSTALLQVLKGWRSRPLHNLPRRC